MSYLIIKQFFFRKPFVKQKIFEIFTKRQVNNLAENKKKTSYKLVTIKSFNQKGDRVKKFSIEKLSIKKLSSRNFIR